MSIKSDLQQPGQRKKITGQEEMDIMRFAENTRHMIVFDVISESCPVSNLGARVRIFLSDEGYSQALESKGRGEIKIIRHARVHKGDLIYDTPLHDYELN